MYRVKILTGFCFLLICCFAISACGRSPNYSKLPDKELFIEWASKRYQTKEQGLTFEMDADEYTEYLSDSVQITATLSNIQLTEGLVITDGFMLMHKQNERWTVFFIKPPTDGFSKTLSIGDTWNYTVTYDMLEKLMEPGEYAIAIQAINNNGSVEILDLAVKFQASWSVPLEEHIVIGNGSLTMCYKVYVDGIVFETEDIEYSSNFYNITVTLTNYKRIYGCTSNTAFTLWRKVDNEWVSIAGQSTLEGDGYILYVGDSRNYTITQDMLVQPLEQGEYIITTQTIDLDPSLENTDERVINIAAKFKIV